MAHVWSQFFPIMWAKGVTLRSLGLVASTLTAEPSHLPRTTGS